MSVCGATETLLIDREAAPALLPAIARRLAECELRGDDQARAIQNLQEFQHLVIASDSFTNIARAGLSLQRSQTAGRLVRAFGPALLYYKRVDSTTPRERDLFDGLENSIEAVYRLTDRPEPPRASASLRRIALEAATAREAFRFTDPAAASPALARGLAGTRADPRQRRPLRA